MKLEILDRLQQDHKQINGLLQILERQFRSIGRGDRPDYELMHQILHYLTHYPDRYHHVVEELLFERLAQRQPAAKPVLHALHDQHDHLTQAGSTLRSRINDVLNGVTLKRAELQQRGRHYLREYREHLEYEEQYIFARLSDELTAADWLALTTTFAWHTDPLYADEVAAEYRLLADRLRSMGAYDRGPDHAYRQACPACSDDGLRLE